MERLHAFWFYAVGHVMTINMGLECPEYFEMPA